MSTPLVSFLLPTRQRAALATRAIEQLVATANDPECFEVMLGVDNDDEENGGAITRACADLPCTIYIMPFEPLGYANLHRYNNELARFANGSWLAIWNDDVLMETVGWDTELRRQRDCVVLDPHVRNARSPFQSGLFPVVPRRWFDVLGHLSSNPHCDTYMFLIADALKIREPGWTVYHDRFDESGQNNDATYQARAYATNAFYDDPDVLARINWDARRLGRALGHPPGVVMRIQTQDEMAALRRRHA